MCQNGISSIIPLWYKFNLGFCNVNVCTKYVAIGHVVNASDWTLFVIFQEGKYDKAVRDKIMLLV